MRTGCGFSIFTFRGLSDASIVQAAAYNVLNVKTLRTPRRITHVNAARTKALL